METNVDVTIAMVHTLKRIKGNATPSVLATRMKSVEGVGRIQCTLQNQVLNYDGVNCNYIDVSVAEKLGEQGKLS